MFKMVKLLRISFLLLGKNDHILYSNVSMALKKLIGEEILSLGTNSVSRHNYLQRSDGDLVVREEDWEQLGYAVSTRLNNLTLEEKRIFPDNAKFKFVFYKFGELKMFILFFLQLLKYQLIHF